MREKVATIPPKTADVMEKAMKAADLIFKRHERKKDVVTRK